MSRSAVDAMLPYMTQIYGNPSSVHSEGQKARAAIFNARRKIAASFGCRPNEIIFTSGGSESDNQALITGAEIGAAQGRRHIISTAFEHHAVLRTLEYLGTKGFDTTLIDIPENGIVEPEAVENAIREDTCLVSVMFANNEIGTIQPVKEIGRICREHGILFHTDAVQAAGHVRINVNEMNIDMMSVSAHKFHGPKGTGALYFRNGLELSSIIRGGGQERGKRAGTENVPGIVGMAAALEEACSNMEDNTVKVRKMRDELISKLSGIEGSYLNGDRNHRLPGNVNYSFDGAEGEALLVLLDEMGICASSGSACSAGSLEPSHVLLSIGRRPDLARNSLRITLDEDNTMEEVNYIARSIREAVERLRGGHC